MARTDPWIVVGGGASGLAAAFALKQRGMEAVVVERDSAPGGRMATVQLGERAFDCGGKNIGKRYTLFRQFAESLGTYPLEYFGLNSSQVIDGTVRTFEARARWRTLRDVMRGVSALDVLRFGRVLLAVKAKEHAGYLGSALSRRLAVRYDRQPLSRYFSPEFCARVLRPMSVRMNGAEPDEIYYGNLGSNVRMILDTYEQFKHGLGPLLRDFAERYDVRLNTTAEELLVDRRRVAGVRVRSQDGRTGELCGAGVIVATPAHVAARLAERILPGLAVHLRTVAYYPVTLIIAEYDRPIFTPSVRAFVFSSDEAVSNAGAYGVNDLGVVRYTFSGRTARPLMAGQFDAGRLLAAGERTLAKYLPVDAAWRRRFVARHFSPGLCAYTPYHGRFLDGLTRETGTVAGLHLTGDYIQGASIEACFRAASACVQRLCEEEQQRDATAVVSALELQAQR